MKYVFAIDRNIGKKKKEKLHLTMLPTMIPRRFPRLASAIPSVPFMSSSSSYSASVLLSTASFSNQSTATPTNSPDSASAVNGKLAELIPSLKSDQKRQQNDEAIAQLVDTAGDSIVRNALTLRSLMAANLHLGHSPKVWNRNMLTYLYGKRGGLHIINLEHTLIHLRRAINVTREVALRGGNIIFVGTKPSLHKLTVDAAKRGNAFFVTEWIGGTITNKERVLRRSSRFDPDKVAQAVALPSGTGRSKKSGFGMTESEEDAAATAEVLQKTHSSQPKVYVPDLLIVLDMPNNITAIREANQLNIPTIAICDSDCDPRLVQYPIPANDDSVTGVELIAGVLSKASQEGFERRMASLHQR
jgi:small subunit ribosomal protein S2